MTEIVKIPFRGDEILTVEHAGKPHVILKPALEAIGLDYSGQLQRLKRRSWAVVGTTPTTGGDGKTYQMVTVDVRTLLMLLATIDEGRVARHVRPKLIAYQQEVADAIEAYWTRGLVVRRGVLDSSVYEPNTYTWDETAALIAQSYGIPLTVNQLTRMLRTGGVLKQNGAPTAKYRNLFWFTGTAWTVHSHVVRQIALKVITTGRELQDFRFIRAQLELEGLGGPAPLPSGVQ